MSMAEARNSRALETEKEEEGRIMPNELVSTVEECISAPSPAAAAEFGRLICAIGVGNALEWFDFAIYGALADIIGLHFFPENAGQTALLASFSVYSSTFLMRPLGGIVMGYIGDNFGRKFALELSITLMIVPGFFMGCLPTFESVGYLATLLLILLRMMQGLAVGGEMIGAYIFTIEACEPTQKGLWGGVCKSTALCGTVLGMGFVTLLRELLTEDELHSWGWRVPFLASVLLGLLGFYLRANLHESEAFTKVKDRGLTDVIAQSTTNPLVSMDGSQSSTTTQAADGNSSSPAASPSPVESTPAPHSHNQTHASAKSAVSATYHVFLLHWPEILLVMCVAAYWSACYYAAFIWMAYYTSDLMPGGGMEQHPGPWVINIAMLIVLVACLPAGGAIGDVVMARWNVNLLGYRRTMAFACVLTILLSVPAFHLINLKHVWSVCLGQGIFAITLSLYGSIMAVVMVEQFEVQHRYLAMGIAYNVASALFGGPAPLIQTALVTTLQRRFDPTDRLMTALCPALYLILVSSLSAVALLWGPSFIDRFRQREGTGTGRRGETGAGYTCSPVKGKKGEEDLEMSASAGCFGLDSSSSPLVSCVSR